MNTLVAITMFDLFQRHPDWSLTFQAESPLEIAVILRVRADKIPDGDAPIALFTKRIIPFEGAFVGEVLAQMETRLADAVRDLLPQMEDDLAKAVLGETSE
jgi:hypothetical protein